MAAPPVPKASAAGDQRSAKRKVWSRDLAMPGKGRGGPPLRGWMLELAKLLTLCKPGEELPAAVIVGSAVIEMVTQGDGTYEWHLVDIERTKRLRKLGGHPQPVWLEPFGK